MASPVDSSQARRARATHSAHITRRFIQTRWKKLSNALYRMHIGHSGGKYSIERMLAFEEYSRQTSLFRVVVVTLSIPLLVIAIVLSQEVFPLQDPLEGWKANWGFWIRVGVFGMENGHEVISQVSQWLGVPASSLSQTVIYCMLTGAGLVAGGIAVAEIWVFPIPFFLLSMSFVLSAVLVGCLRIVVGAERFGQMTSRRDQLRQMNNVVTMQTFMCSAYPAYQVLFSKANHTPYELPVILLLSLFKVVMKKIYASAAAHQEDMIPKQVIFTVDVFGAFYLATFMQTFSSTTLAAVMLVDFVETVVELRELHQRTQNILTHLKEAAGINTNNENDTNILVAVRSLLNDPRMLNKQMYPGTQVRSVISHQLSGDGRDLLEKTASYTQDMTRISSPTVSICSQDRTNEQSKHAKKSIVAVHPAEVVGKVSDRPKANKRVEVGGWISAPKNPTILQETLEVLFTSECLVLTEYVEIIIPVMYATFVYVTVHLPSAQYHTEMQGVTLDNVGGMVSRMFAYALMELVSFIVLAVIMKRNCGIQALYQLAFVLDTELTFVPSKLVHWIMYTLTYRVAHFGTSRPSMPTQLDSFVLSLPICLKCKRKYCY